MPSLSPMPAFPVTVCDEIASLGLMTATGRKQTLGVRTIGRVPSIFELRRFLIASNDTFPQVPRNSCDYQQAENRADYFDNAHDPIVAAQGASAMGGKRTLL